MNDNSSLDVPKPDSLDQIGTLDLDLEQHSCWLFHSWGPWKDYETGTISRGDITIGRYIYQERRCSHCNKVQLNKIRN